MSNGEIFTLAAISLVVLVVLVVYASVLNKLLKLSGQVNLTIGTLAAQYQQRHDLIPDVLRAAKEAVKAQREYFDKMLEVRKGMHPGLTPLDLGGVPADLVPIVVAGHTAGASKPVTESNPTMSTDTYNELQRIMHDTEKDVTAARRFYWAAVTEYNNAVGSFPASMVASLHGYRLMPTATISPGLEAKPTLNW